MGGYVRLLWFYPAGVAGYITLEASMRYRTVEQIVRKVKREPDAKFKRMIRCGKLATARGYFTKTEFLKVCKWKSSRRIALCRSNSEQVVRRATRQAFAATDEERRMKSLLQLAGVGVPTASALLAVSSPNRFGVIDRRAWRFLHSIGVVNCNRQGLNLSTQNWLLYLNILRDVAKQIRSTPRLVEISLYWAHKNAQLGVLYSAQAFNPSFKRTCLRHAA